MAGCSRDTLFCLCVVFLSATAAVGYNFKVGGSGEWKVPESNAGFYNQWAEANRFSIGDTISFTYPGDKDAVLFVDESAYKSCDTSSPIDKFTGGSTVFTFNATYKSCFFISSNKDSCDKGEKLHIVVLADRSNKNNNAPAPSNNASPAPPSPAAEGQAPPAASPPEGSSGEPTPAESTPPPSPSFKNGASTKTVGAAAAAALAVAASVAYYGFF